MPAMKPLNTTVRNRVIERRRMAARLLMDNDGNPKTHPGVQRDTMIGVLQEIGQAGALLAYYSARRGGELVLINGHLRRGLDPDLEWDVDITDLTDAEADLLMLIYDPLAAMAEVEKNRALALLETVQAEDLAVREMLRRMELSTRQLAEEIQAEDAAATAAATPKDGPEGMELLPLEHYDYVMLLFRNELDWVAACEIFNLERRSDQRNTTKVGLARGVEGSRVINLIRQLREENDALKARLPPEPAKKPTNKRTGPPLPAAEPLLPAVEAATSTGEG